MSEIIRGIFDVVIWTFVPVVLGMVIARAYRIAEKIENKHYKKTARSGFWAGIILFIMILIYQVSIFLTSGFPDKTMYQGFNLLLAIASATLTFPVFYGGRKIPPKFAGWILLIVTSVSCVTLFHYIFVHTYNEYILSAVLGIAFGIFTHTAFSPITLDDLIKFSV